MYYYNQHHNQLVFPVSDKLGIPHDHVLCNEIYFSNGLYSGFDHTRLINHSKGKCLEIQKVLAETGIDHSVMIGDGATDLETKDVVDAFICFMGVKDRPSVSSQSDLVIASFHDLLSFFSLVFKQTLQFNRLQYN